MGREAGIGEGLQREVQYVVFQRYVREQTSWFQPSAGGFFTFRTLYPLSLSIPASRLIAAKRLGAICALMMVFGQSPMLLSPAIFQYLIHDGNFNSLHPAFIGEWFPDIRLTMLDFLSAGPDADLAPFAAHLLTYLDMEVTLIWLFLFLVFSNCSSAFRFPAA